MKTAIIIPSRMASKRFPNKPMAKINGKPMIERVYEKVKKNNITPENIGEIILSQIPGISSVTSQVIMNEFGSLYNLLHKLKENQKCLDDLYIITNSGNKRRITKTGIRNIVQYLLYQKSNIIKVETF